MKYIYIYIYIYFFFLFFLNDLLTTKSRGGYGHYEKKTKIK